MAGGNVRFLVVLLALSHPHHLWGHGGGLDKYGCHNDRKRGGYHCHRSGGQGNSSSTTRKTESTTAAIPPIPDQSIRDNWRFSKEKSPIDDKTTFILSKDGDTSIYASYRSVLPSLHIRCREGDDLELFVVVHQMVDYKYSTGTSPVRIRFDAEKHLEEVWGTSTDREALFVPEPEKFFSQIRNHKKVMIEFTPYNRAAQIASFTFAGLPSELAAMKAACPSKLEEAEVASPGADESPGQSKAEASSLSKTQSKDVAAAEPMSSEVRDYVERIYAKIRGRLIRPNPVQGNSEGVFQVILIPGGEVLSVSMRKSSGDTSFDAAVERAIMAAAPFQVPPDSATFQEYFREFSVKFRPLD